MRKHSAFSKSMRLVLIIGAYVCGLHAWAIAPQISDATVMESMEAVNLPSKNFGTGTCTFRIQGIFKGPGAIVMKIERGQPRAKCGFTTLRLTTPRGEFELEGVGLSNTEQRTVRGTDQIVLNENPGSIVLLRFKVDVDLTDQELALSGLWEPECNDRSCMNDAPAVDAMNDRVRQALVNKIQSSRPTPVRHRLLDSQPSTLLGSNSSYDGSLKEIDWFIAGIHEAIKKDPKARQKFSEYIATRDLFFYRNTPTDPFEKKDFETMLIAQRSIFVEAVLSYEPAPLPKGFVTFTPIRIDNYNFQTEELTVSPCIRLDSCGQMPVAFPTDTLETEVHALGADIEVIKSRRVYFNKFRTFMGHGNSGAPLYLLSRTVPGPIKLKVPQAQARLLYELAKTVPTSRRASLSGGEKATTLVAKIEYSGPRFMEFVARNGSTKTLLGEYIAGASVSYSIEARAICIYDGSGLTAVYCQDLPASSRLQ